MPFPISFVPPLGIYTGLGPVRGEHPGAALRQIPQWFTGSGAGGAHLTGTIEISLSKLLLILERKGRNSSAPDMGGRPSLGLDQFDGEGLPRMGRGPGEGFTHQLPRASSPASPSPGWISATRHGQVKRGVGDPAEAYASWEGCSSSDTRDTVLLRLSSLHPWALLGGVAMEGASQSNHSPFLGPLGHPHGRGQKTGTNPG